MTNIIIHIYWKNRDSERFKPEFDQFCPSIIVIIIIHSATAQIRPWLTSWLLASRLQMSSVTEVDDHDASIEVTGPPAAIAGIRYLL